MKDVQITLKAHKHLAKLNKQDMAFIYEALEALKDWPNVSGVKNLTNRPGYRLRIGQYRALFEITGDAVIVTEIKRRNEHTY
ncbi:MAG: type II toxin-antitoxin system RelE/ParE family toxin [Candidatus Adiutrix sp.]|jgi:mRNA interferase RelE/StbE|nr:type II toxin-antitoxin system RelE/ParE family toxin [Candidatus Adiutrix sp.]